MADEDPIAKIKSLQAQILKETDALKLKLAKQLNGSCETLKLLVELGNKDVLAEPQFAEYVHLLGSSIVPEPAPSPVKRGRKSDGISVKDTVLKVMEGGKEFNIAALTTEVEKIYGKVSKASINNALMLLKKGKVIKSTGRGLYKKA